MKQKYLSLLMVLILGVLLSSCQQQQDETTRIVIAIPSDAESLNPLFSFSFQEVNISEILYLSLVQHEWDQDAGDLKSSPMIAKSWVWSDDSSSITFELRDDIKWRDGQKLTSNDVVFSFDLYSDPDVQSRFYGTFEKFFTESNQHIDMVKTFEVTGPYQFKINFKPGSNPVLVDIDIPVIPEHVFSRMDRKEIFTTEKGHDTITSGPFYLKKWEKNQSLVLRRNENSFLNDPGNPDEIIFKIIPNYNSRITQLKNGSIDFTDGIKPDQVDELTKNGNFHIEPVKGREYDYAAWNNIDPDLYSVSGKIKAHKLFGNVIVRKALTYAINRDEILSGYLGGYGDAATGPVAPIFKDYYNDLKPAEYNPAKARDMLLAEGWKDDDKNGILEKDGEEFSFILNYAAGNLRREYAATIIRSNLKSIGIDVKTEPMEAGIFFEKMFNRELNAWLGGWSVPIPLNLTPYWGSDFNKSSLNLSGYIDTEVDMLLNKISSSKSKEEKSTYYKKIQEIINNDSPVTFLYWIDNITAYNKRLEEVKITPLGSIHRCWAWQIK